MLVGAPLPLGSAAPPRLVQALRDGRRGPELAAAHPEGLVLSNREGEPAWSCEAHYERVPDTAEARRALRDAGMEGGEEDEPAGGVLRLSHHLGGGEYIVRGTARWRDGELVLETNGEARMERLQALVAQALPAARLLWEERIDPLLAADDHDRFGIPDVPEEPSADERAVLAQFLHKYEEKWVDEPIPALDGRSPRQAAQVPELRQRLYGLLAEPGMMDRAHLEQLLGL